MFSTSVLLLSAVVAGTDPDADRVLTALERHFAAIHSVRFRGVERVVKSGGLLADDPVGSKIVHDPTRSVETIEAWFAPPKHRVIKSETRQGADGKSVTISSRTYFDGQTFTRLFPAEKSGIVVTPGASQVSEPSGTPIHATGVCYPFTFRTDLAALLTNRSNVSVERAGAVGGSEPWMVQIRSLPKDVRPKGSDEKIGQGILVRIWLTLDPVVVQRWVIYFKASGDRADAGAEAQIYGTPPSSVRLDGYHVIDAYVNCDHRPCVDETGGRTLPMPRRIVRGNGLGCTEFQVQEFVVNPRESADTFRTAIPTGYKVTRYGGEGQPQLELTGGREGETVRVGQITQEAKALLADGEALRSSPGMSWYWGVSLACLVLVVGAGVVRFWRRRRTS